MITEPRPDVLIGDARPSALGVDRLAAGYGALTVVNVERLTVERGEIVGLLGRNGAGKSTTILAVGGYLARTRGEVRVNGKLVEGKPYSRTRDDLGIVLEGRSVFPSLSVADNLRVGGVEVDRVISLFPELKPKLSVSAGMLSGGEQQMLVIGRAIARDPAVLLIDELSFGLAPIVCGRIYELLRHIAATTPVGVLLVEQQITNAAAVVDRAVVMNEGQIVGAFSADELRSGAAEVERIYLARPASGGRSPR